MFVLTLKKKKKLSVYKLCPENLRAEQADSPLDTDLDLA